MKKALCLFLILTMTAFLFACGAAENTADTDSPEAAKASSVSAKEDKNREELDLTKLSGTMVYSEVFNINSNPSDFIGKIVKLNGKYTIFQARDAYGQPIPDQFYHCCVVSDASACCQEGLEFILSDAYHYPDDYPKPGTFVTIAGELQTYMEGDYQYCHLINAELA